MDFGLGLILSFTDNATAGINNAVNSLDRLTQTAEGASNSLNQMASLSALSVVADQLGGAFLGAGSTILSTLGQVIGTVNETGQSLMFAENQLNALYASSNKTGKEVVGQIQQYAKESMFDFEQLIPAVISLKSVGIEAFDAITSSTGNAQHSLLDYASALASFAPQMKNAYGTGVNAAIGAMREYIAEGNEMSLKRGAGLDITGILGEDKGASIEERTRQVADLVEQLGMLSMVETMKDSPQVKLSNMGDTLFQLKGMISDSGVREAINGIIDVFYDFVSSISDERLQNIANNIGSALSSLIAPLEWVSKKIVVLAEGIVSLVENNPALVKFATVGLAIAGVLLVLAGVVLKFTSALSGVSLILLTMGQSFSSIGSLIKVGALKMLGTLLPLTATIALLALAWKGDLAGIRTNVTNFADSVSNSFRTARSAIDGNVSDLRTSLSYLRNEDDFHRNLTIGFAKIMMAGRALADAWGDNELSEENFLKAKELGILPLIEAILDLKYRFGLFKEGFIAGWKEVSDKVSSFLLGITDSLDGTVFEGLLTTVTDFMQKLSNNDPEAWREFGEIIGGLSAKFMLAFVALKLFNSVAGKVMGVITIFSKLAGVVKGIPALFGGLGGKISNVLHKMFPNIHTVLQKGLQTVFKSNIQGIIPNIRIWFAGVQDAIVGAVTGIASAIGAPVWAVVAVIVAVLSTIFIYASTHWEEFKAKIVSVWENIKEKGLEIWNAIKEGLLSIWNNLQTSIAPVIDAFNALKDKFTELFEKAGQNETIQAFIGFLSAIGETIVGIVIPAINTIISVIASVLIGIWNIVVTIVNSIVSFVSNILYSLSMIISGILDIIVGIFTLDFGLVYDGVVQVFTGILSIIYGLLSAAWNVVMSILTAIGSVFSTVWNGISETVSGAIQGIVSTVGSWLLVVFSLVSSVWNSISTTIGGVLDDISSSVSEKWESIKTTISDAINGAKDAVKTAIDKIKGFFDFEWSLPKLKLPEIQITGGFSLAPPSVPKFDLVWKEDGGVFSKPTVIGVGENGREAVMPLEKHTGWISHLARMITTDMDRNNLVPTNTGEFVTNNQGDTNQKYLTSNSTTHQTIQGDTDNSIVFSTGAIQLNVQNASEEEAIRLARKIMEYIKRQRELDRMTAYA